MKRLKSSLKTRVFAIVTIIVLVVSAILYRQLSLTNASPDVKIQLPNPSGHYVIGRTRFDWTDFNRRDPFYPSLNRRLVVWVWYPAHTVGSSAPAAYLPGKWGKDAARWSALTIRIHTSPTAIKAFTTAAPISPSSLENIQVHAVEDAPLAKDQTFPTLIFSPGLGQMATDYTALIEDTVSHGYIVAGLNPTYFTDVTVFANGTEVGHMPFWKRSLDVESYYPTWVADFLFVANQVCKLNQDSPSQFASSLDLVRLGAFGHSYGGAAVVGACYRDARFKAGIDLDGSPRGGSESWRLAQPFLVLQSDQGVHRDRGQVRFAKDLKSGHLFVITGAHHAAFTDAAVFPLPEEGRKSWIGTISGSRMVQIASTVIESFFDATLCGKADKLNALEHGQIPELRIER